MAAHAPSGQHPRRSLAGEAREASGVTSTLLLAYLEDAGGPAAVAEVLACCGLSDCEQELRSESCWFSWETKIALLQATAAVLDRPNFLPEMAAKSLDLNVSRGLKVALRMLGSPRLVYRNIVRANARFNGSHEMQLLHAGDTTARIAFLNPGERRRYHPLDCRYSAEMLRIVPQLFGLPPAHLSHPQCMGDGADACVYDLRWGAHPPVARRVAFTALGGSAALGAAATFAPIALPAAGALCVGGAGLIAREHLRHRRRRWRHIQREAEDNEKTAQRLFASLQDLLSDLRLEKVLPKVTRNAQTVLGGREVVLLVREGDGLMCQSSSGLALRTVAAVEAWANGTPRLLDEAVVLDDVSEIPALRSLSAPGTALRSLASAPLSSAEGALGVLVALGAQRHSFLPRDADILRSYAAQVTIALGNARRYDAEKTLAAHDPLTGLLNHRSFHEKLDAEIASSRRESFLSSVALIDLDCFKRVNDEDGHPAGDRLLRAVARALTDSCRRDDLAFRVGGDEFALLLHRQDHDAASEIAERVCGAIDSLDLRLGASAGVATIPLDGADKASVLAEADRRLYAAKRGQDHVVAERRGVELGGVPVEAAMDLALAVLLARSPLAAERAAAARRLVGSMARRLGMTRHGHALVALAAVAHQAGADPQLLARDPSLQPVADALAALGERWDGAGTPAGLAGEEIPMASRVLAVCDAYIRAAGSAGTGAEVDEALEALRALAGVRFDPEIVQALASELASAAPAPR